MAPICYGQDLDVIPAESNPVGGCQMRKESPASVCFLAQVGGFGVVTVGRVRELGQWNGPNPSSTRR